jgi:hypothetical protein
MSAIPSIVWRLSLAEVVGESDIFVSTPDWFVAVSP